MKPKNYLLSIPCLCVKQILWSIQLILNKNLLFIMKWWAWDNFTTPFPQISWWFVFYKLIQHCKIAVVFYKTELKKFNILVKSAPSGLIGEIILDRFSIKGDKLGNYFQDLLTIYQTLLWTLKYIPICWHFHLIFVKFEFEYFLYC